ncbi:MAG TPA: hypothetical protein VFZ53_16805 [Polyangiaceae bacterium]
MRLFALTPLAIALGAGSVALAEPVAIVDPWNRSSSDTDSWFGSEAPPAEPAGDPEIVDPWARAALETKAPVVERSRAPNHVEATAKAAPAFVPTVASGLDDKTGIEDPWGPSFAATETPSLQSSARARSPSWSEPMVEVVDPWQRRAPRGASERLRLLVDPWAR